MTWGRSRTGLSAPFYNCSTTLKAGINANRSKHGASKGRGVGPEREAPATHAILHCVVEL